MAANGIDVIANVKLFDLDAALATKDPVVPTKTVLAISGTTKDDIVTVNAKADMQVTINTDEGNDTVRAASSQAAISVNTGIGKDWVEGGFGNDRIILGDGNDTTYAGAGNDFVDGGRGSDYINSGEGNDKVVGGAGRDYIEGQRGDDQLWGNDASNVDDNDRDNFIYRLDRTLKNNKVNLSLEWGNDTIHDFHAHANDKKGDLIEMDDFFMRLSDVDVKKILDAVDGAVTLKGGKFYDSKGTLFSEGYYDDEDQLVDVHNSNTSGIGNLGAKDKAPEVAAKETVYDLNGLDGGTYRVSIKADWDSETNRVSMKLTFTNSLNADDKGASITIKNADDLNAVASFDRETMKLVHGADDAAKGDVIDLTSDAFKTALGGKGAYFYGFAGNDKVTGTDVDDNLGGGDGVDTINGGKGNDRVYGDAGNDELRGGAGNDYLSGGADNDRLYGDAGNDTLWGGSGTNFLTGGGDKDTFNINGSGLTFANDGHAIATLESTKTVITDFDLYTDKIKLGDVFADYRISNTEAQKEKYIYWLKTHIEMKDVAGKLKDSLMTYEADGKNDLVIHLNTKDDYNNVLVIANNDNGDAQTMYNNIINNKAYDLFFVFG